MTCVSDYHLYEIARIDKKYYGQRANTATLIQVFLFALAIVNLVAVNHGFGQPSSSLRTADLQLALQVCLTVYNTTSIFDTMRKF
jgi:hypothetical protein